MPWTSQWVNMDGDSWHHWFFIYNWYNVIIIILNYTPLHNEVVSGGILVSLRPSVRLSIRPASRVRSVAPTVLVGSISYIYIYISSSNFRRCVARCVACKIVCKIPKFEFLAIFFKICNFDFVLFWLGIRYESLVWVTISECRHSSYSSLTPEQGSCWGVYWFHSVRLSVRLSRLPCPLCNIYSTGWIISILATNDHTMRGCVAHNDLWPWPISSRSFSLDLENRVRSVVSTVLDGFFLYLSQMITIIRGCVTC